MEGHTHGKDARADATVVGYLVTNDGEIGGIHNEPDIGFDAAYFDVGFIGDKRFSFLVGILAHKGVDADSGGLAVVGDLLMGDLDVIEIFEDHALALLCRRWGGFCCGIMVWKNIYRKCGNSAAGSDLEIGKSAVRGMWWNM